jgi:modulator of FtsH protease HflC
MKNSKVIYIILVAVMLILLSNSVFILDETEQAIVTQFGKACG